MSRITSHNTIRNRRMLARSASLRHITVTSAIILAVFGIAYGLQFITSERDQFTQITAEQPEILTNDPSSEITPLPPSDATASSGIADASCGTSVPVAACAAVRSIESVGLSGNQYVAVDISQFPAGTSISIDESSWRQEGGGQATVDATAIQSSQATRYRLGFTLGADTWKLTSYAQL